MSEARARCATFSVLAESDPGLLPRLLGQIAKRGLIPERFAAQLAEDRHSLQVDFILAGLPVAVTDHIAEAIGAMPGILRIRTA